MGLPFYSDIRGKFPVYPIDIYFFHCYKKLLLPTSVVAILYFLIINVTSEKGYEKKLSPKKKLTADNKLPVI